MPRTSKARPPNGTADSMSGREKTILASPKANAHSHRIAAGKLIGRMSKWDRQILDMGQEEYADYAGKELRIVRRRMVKRLAKDLDQITPNAIPVAISILADNERKFADLTEESRIRKAKPQTPHSPRTQVNILQINGANLDRDALMTAIQGKSPLPRKAGEEPTQAPETSQEGQDTTKPVPPSVEPHD